MFAKHMEEYIVYQAEVPTGDDQTTANDAQDQYQSETGDDHVDFDDGDNDDVDEDDEDEDE